MPDAPWDFTQGMLEAVAAGLSDAELIELRLRWSDEYDRELKRRVSHIDKKTKERILWDSVTENLIPLRPPDVSPCNGYIVLPIRSLHQYEETNILLVPPYPRKAVEIPWPWNSEFIFWIMDPSACRGARWIEAMLEEFGLPPEAQKPWASPSAGSYVLDAEKLCAFHKEVKVAQKHEAVKRLHNGGLAGEPWPGWHSEAYTAYRHLGNRKRLRPRG